MGESVSKESNKCVCGSEINQETKETKSEKKTKPDTEEIGTNLNKIISLETNKVFDLSYIMKKILNPIDYKSKKRQAILDEIYPKIHQISHEINSFCQEPAEFIKNTANKKFSRSNNNNSCFYIGKYSDIAELKLVNCQAVKTIRIVSNDLVLDTITNNNQEKIDLGYIFSGLCVYCDMYVYIEPNIPECKLMGKLLFLNRHIKAELMRFRFKYKNIGYLGGVNMRLSDMFYQKVFEGNYIVTFNNVYQEDDKAKQYSKLSVYGLNEGNCVIEGSVDSIKRQKQQIKKYNPDAVFEEEYILVSGDCDQEKNAKDKTRMLQVMEWFENDNAEYPDPIKVMVETD